MTLPLLELARAKGVCIATAESCTGGMIAARITDSPGTSAIFECAFVTYSYESKIRMLGIRQQTLTDHGAVSEEIAREMVEGALARSRATLAVSVTGIAGPGDAGHKPEGRVCFGLATAEWCRTETVEFGALGRDRVREATVDYALSLLFDALSAMPDS
ncbi:Putative competence-damaged inducible protein [Oceanicola granulosus HTCC2516]|uniref:Putative competence-damaged inducible protein n=1 Tax=Oceanicola granulosus (strain ATCC BAA-861 / DSM 15982 / KCTC 12143 / HTCC2516) TaxID=314256 RepID=Q2CD09_OCEGH|nr:CinA family protein [Oceanicola granulosus]EAR50567.1 Putative competence-damaged inducible protein [Oceanicola granulosus HTCC2516]